MSRIEPQELLNIFEFEKIKSDQWCYTSFHVPKILLRKVKGWRFIIRFNYDFYYRLRLEILDSNKQIEQVLRISSFHRDNEFQELCHNLEKYQLATLGYYIFRTVKTYNVIFNSSKLVFYQDCFKLYEVVKYSEKSRWGGVDKDNTFIEYKQTYYFLAYNYDIMIDDYLRSILPSSDPVQINSYEEYKSSSATKSDFFEILEADKDTTENFKSKYNIDEHNEYLKLLLDETVIL